MTKWKEEQSRSNDEVQSIYKEVKGTTEYLQQSDWCKAIAMIVMETRVQTRLAV